VHQITAKFRLIFTEKVYESTDLHHPNRRHKITCSTLTEKSYSIEILTAESIPFLWSWRFCCTSHFCSNCSHILVYKVSSRYSDHDILQFLVHINGHLWYICSGICLINEIFVHFKFLFTTYLKIYTAMNLHSVHSTTYTPAMKRSSRFRLHPFENHISISLLVYEKIQWVSVVDVQWILPQQGCHLIKKIGYLT
jgi:hypothetical protein